MTEDAPRALVFDFDGLILDTETPEFRAWQELFAAHGGRLTTADWAHVIGSMDSGGAPMWFVKRIGVRGMAFAGSMAGCRICCGRTSGAFSILT